jgi:hypothetical protein
MPGSIDIYPVIAFEPLAFAIHPQNARPAPSAMDFGPCRTACSALTGFLDGMDIDDNITRSSSPSIVTNHAAISSS